MDSQENNPNEPNPPGRNLGPSPFSDGPAPSPGSATPPPVDPPRDAMPPPPPPPPVSSLEPLPPMSSYGAPASNYMPIAILMIVGGVWALIWSGIVVAGGFGCFTLCLGPLYGVVLAIFAISNGVITISQHQRPPMYPAIMMICNIINCDLLNVILGVVIIVLLNSLPPEPEISIQ